MNMMRQLNSKSAKVALEEYVYVSKYAKFLHDEQRRETWPETVLPCSFFLLDT